MTKMIELPPHGDTHKHSHAAEKTAALPKEVQAQFQEEMHRLERANRAKLYTPHEIAIRLFRVQAQRIAKNAALKLYKFMLEPLVQGEHAALLCACANSHAHSRCQGRCSST